jgi:hypothetical protein
LVEPQRQLLISYPRVFARSEWTKINGRIEGDPTTAGVDLLAGWDFTNWTSSGAIIVDSNTFTAISTGGGIRKSGLVTNNKLYRVKISGNIQNGAVQLQDWNISSNYVGVLTGNFSIDSYFISQGTLLSFVITSVTGTLQADIISFELQEVIAFDCPLVNSSGVNTKEAFKFVATANNAILRRSSANIYTTVAASTYTNSVFLKRITGTGQVSIIDVNNVARPITITNEWQRYEYAAAANDTSGQICIQLATSGDEVMICHAQAELGANSTSPIYGTEGGTRTREADDNRVDLPSGVTEVQLTNMSDTVTTDASPSDPYVMPLGTWKKIIMI